MSADERFETEGPSQADPIEEQVVKDFEVKHGRFPSQLEALMASNYGPLRKRLKETMAANLKRAAQDGAQ